MAHDDTTFDAIFCGALEIASAEERAAYLDRGLRRRTRTCVAASRACSTPTSRPAASSRSRPTRPPSRRPPAPPAEGPGTVIGPYKLLQQIGEGGMGIVFMAEQTAAGPAARSR